MLSLLRWIHEQDVSGVSMQKEQQQAIYKDNH